MPYCLTCGKQIPERAKFCPLCGERTAFEELKIEPATPNPPVPINLVEHHDHETSATFTLLEVGQLFNGYTVVKALNKDFEGIKYIVKKEGKPETYLLKIFHNAFFDNVEKLFNLQMRLTKLHTLICHNAAKVLEINQHDIPRYMVVEYIQGTSLNQIRLHDSQHLTEEYIRNVTTQLIAAAICIRKHGLSVHELTPVGVLIDDHHVLKILSTGIIFDNTDEREDIFAIGLIVAQMLCKSGLYQTLYSDLRLRQNKYVFISDVTISMNKFLAECLHRNANQRFHSLSEMQKQFTALPPIDQDTIHISREQFLDKLEPLNDVEAPPRFRKEYGFWTLIIVVALLLLSMLTTNVYSYLFGDKNVDFQFKSFTNKPDSLAQISSQSLDKSLSPFDSSTSTTSTGYGNFRSTNNTPQKSAPNDYRQNFAIPTTNTDSFKSQAPKSNPIPTNYVYIESDTYGFGRLRENLHHNVSVSGFYISKYEITQAEWNQFMRPANVSLRGDNLPVDNVSWMDIAIFANGKSEAASLTPCYHIRGLGKARVVTCDFRANGYRLPTDVEWEMAAKGGELYDYSGSDQIEDVAWYKDNSAAKIHPPAQKAANGFKIYDMTGNVSEWCWDWFDINYPRNLSIFVNPTGPEAGSMKTIRGGNITNGEGRNTNILFRDRGDPSRGYPFVGFRLVRTAQ